MNLAQWKKLDIKKQLNIYYENNEKLILWRCKQCQKNVQYVDEN